jgi:hypothetical protein
MIGFESPGAYPASVFFGVDDPERSDAGKKEEEDPSVKFNRATRVSNL